MKNEHKKLFIVALLPKHAGWRGEGIAQTIENMIVNLPVDVSVSIVINWWHRKDLEEGIKGREIEIISTGKVLDKKKYNQSALINADNEGFFTRILNKIELTGKSIFVYVDYIKYLFNFNINSIKLRLKIRSNDILWIPIPTLPMPSFNKNKNIIISFWDSFGFEYSEFGFYAKMNALKSIMSKLDNCKKVVTQSSINRSYLIDVLKVDSNKVMHLPVGSPDYSRYLIEFEGIKKSNINDCLACWGDPECWSFNKKQAIESIGKDLMAKSVFFRLMQKLNQENKFVILVSTQARPYKGLEVFLRLMQHMKNSNSTRKPILLFTTELPIKIKEKFPELFEDIHEFSRLNQKRHAFLNYLSDVIIHPSFVEGGDGAYPSFEAQSLNKPSTINVGRHTAAWLGGEEYGCVSDLTDLDGATNIIYKILDDENFAKNNVKYIKGNRHDWEYIADRFNAIIKDL